MKNILLIIVRYGTHLLFILFQILCFTLIIKSNDTHNKIYNNTKSIFFANFNNKTDQLGDYLKLEENNDSLARENAKLMNIIINQPPASVRISDTIKVDTILANQYSFISAEICNKTLNLRNNYFTLCKGSNDGIKSRMGVVSAEGIVGIITKVSPHYSRVIPLIHSQSRISAAVKNSEFFGSLRWQDSDPRVMRLEDVPRHAPVSVGDTIITSGYSSIFPRGLPIGTITYFEVEKGSSNFSIDIRLFNDFYNLSHAYIVVNKLMDEKLILETEADE